MSGCRFVVSRVSLPIRLEPCQVGARRILGRASIVLWLVRAAEKWRPRLGTGDLRVVWLGRGGWVESPGGVGEVESEWGAIWIVGLGL